MRSRPCRFGMGSDSAIRSGLRIDQPPGGPGPGREIPNLRLARQSRTSEAIQGWLGHRSITGTAVYTTLAPNRFKDFGGTEPGASQGLGATEIAKALGIGRASVYRVLEAPTCGTGIPIGGPE
jgi:hypothetical protein